VRGKDEGDQRSAAYGVEDFVPRTHDEFEYVSADLGPESTYLPRRTMWILGVPLPEWFIRVALRPVLLDNSGR